MPGECYTLLGAKFVEEVVEASQPETRSRAKILDEDDQDFVNISKCSSSVTKLSYLIKYSWINTI